jgi:hypothetical protein
MPNKPVSKETIMDLFYGTPTKYSEKVGDKWWTEHVQKLPAIKYLAHSRLLVAIDANGSMHTLLKIKSNGTILLMPNVPDNLGLKVCKNGRLVISNS